MLTRCVCETQMPPIMANSKDGQDHKDIYFDTSEKIFSQEMTLCNMGALIFKSRSYDKCQGQKVSTNRKNLSQKYSCEISLALALTNQIL